MLICSDVLCECAASPWPLDKTSPLESNGISGFCTGETLFPPSVCHGCQHTLFPTGIPPTAAAYAWHWTMGVMSRKSPHNKTLLIYVQDLAFWTLWIFLLCIEKAKSMQAWIRKRPHWRDDLCKAIHHYYKDFGCREMLTKAVTLCSVLCMVFLCIEIVVMILLVKEKHFN